MRTFSCTIEPTTKFQAPLSTSTARDLKSTPTTANCPYQKSLRSFLLSTKDFPMMTRTLMPTPIISSCRCPKNLRSLFISTKDFPTMTKTIISTATWPSPESHPKTMNLSRWRCWRLDTCSTTTRSIPPAYHPTKEHAGNRQSSTVTHIRAWLCRTTPGVSDRGNGDG